VVEEVARLVDHTAPAARAATASVALAGGLRITPIGRCSARGARTMTADRTASQKDGAVVSVIEALLPQP
jgi:hypothetical protein